MKDIDNLVLGVGDVNRLVNIECASSETYKMSEQQRGHCVLRGEFDKVEWYHQSSMRRQDVVFFANRQVPHFSVNRGVLYQTQERTALVASVQYRNDQRREEDN